MLTECIYHLRYFKTTPCIHDSNELGVCYRYGRHCAFCHGEEDFRAPIFDVPSPAMAPLLTYGMNIPMGNEGAAVGGGGGGGAVSLMTVDGAMTTLGPVFTLSIDIFKRKRELILSTGGMINLF